MNNAPSFFKPLLSPQGENVSCWAWKKIKLKERKYPEKMWKWFHTTRDNVKGVRGKIFFPKLLYSSFLTENWKWLKNWLPTISDNIFSGRFFFVIEKSPRSSFQFTMVLGNKKSVVPPYLCRLSHVPIVPHSRSLKKLYFFGDIYVAFNAFLHILAITSILWQLSDRHNC